MSDRIAVMSNGRVEQVGPPKEVYEEPSTAYVADFLGVSNLMDAPAAGATDGGCRVQPRGVRARRRPGRGVDRRRSARSRSAPSGWTSSPRATTGQNRDPGDRGARRLRGVDAADHRRTWRAARRSRRGRRTTATVTRTARATPSRRTSPARPSGCCRSATSPRKGFAAAAAQHGPERVGGGRRCPRDRGRAAGSCGRPRLALGAAPGRRLACSPHARTAPARARWPAAAPRATCAIDPDAPRSSVARRSGSTSGGTTWITGSCAASCERYAAWDVDVRDRELHDDAGGDRAPAGGRRRSTSSSRSIRRSPGMVAERAAAPARPRRAAAPGHALAVLPRLRRAVLRRGAAVHGAVHGVLDGDRLADRPGRSGSGRPTGSHHPYDTFWDPSHRGEVGIVDDHREAIAMALLRRGEDPNTADATTSTPPCDDLIAMTEVVDVEISGDGAYHELQTGEYAIQQAWSGDVLAAKRFGPGTAATLARTGYVWPAGGVVGLRPDGGVRERAEPRPRPRVPRPPPPRGGRARQLRVERLPAAGGARDARAAFGDPAFPWADVVPEHLRGRCSSPGTSTPAGSCGRLPPAHGRGLAGRAGSGSARRSGD